MSKKSINDAAKDLLQALEHTPFTDHPTSWSMETWGDFLTQLRKLAKPPDKESFEQKFDRLLKKAVEKTREKTAHPSLIEFIEKNRGKKITIKGNTLTAEPEEPEKVKVGWFMCSEGGNCPHFQEEKLSNLDSGTFPKLLNANAIMTEHEEKYHFGGKCALCQKEESEPRICTDCYVNKKS